LSSESGDNWGVNGLGYYVAARCLWDIDEARRVDAIVDDFLTKLFGPAKEPMAEFYKLIDASSSPLMSADLIGRMYRLLDRAGTLTACPKIRARINDLILYTRYVELFRAYAESADDKRQRSFETLIRYAYRMRKSMMVHTKGLYKDLEIRDDHAAIPQGAQWEVPEEQNPFKSSEPFVQEELNRYVSEGVARHRLRDFEPVSFGRKLVPAAKLNLQDASTGTFGNYGRGLQIFHTWTDKPAATIALKVTGGFMYQGRGNVKVDLWYVGEGGQEHVDHGECPPDQQEYAMTLQAAQPGAYRMTISDGGNATKVVWEEGVPMTHETTITRTQYLQAWQWLSGVGRAAGLQQGYELYFYVPKGTRVVGLYAPGAGSIMDGSGTERFCFDDKPAGYYGIPVPEGQDGKAWHIHHGSGQIRLMTVPPYLARSPKELLLPEKVIEADAVGAHASLRDRSCGRNEARN
jgi:hypothetical protein